MIDKVPISMRALVQRINRALAKVGPDRRSEAQKLCVSRPNSMAFHNLGKFHVVNVYYNRLERSHVDPEKFGRQLGVLADWEHIES